MSPLKRLSVLCLDVLLFLGGLVFTLYVCVSFLYLQALFAPALFAGCCISGLVLFLRRRRVQNSTLGIEAERFLAARRAAALNPKRMRVLRRIARQALWLPSMLAFSVLFFFPECSHLVHPGAQRLIRNHVHIPWDCTILFTFEASDHDSRIETICGGRSPWPFAWHYPWDRTARLSNVSFRSVPANEIVERRNGPALWWQSSSTSENVRELRSRGITLTCRQYLVSGGVGNRIVSCETTSPLQPWNFEPAFYGRLEDIPKFYEVIRDFGPAR